MTRKTKLDSLIEAARQVINNNFDPAAFLNWRRNALDYLTEILGPGHHYTRCFQEFVQDGQDGPLLAGQGILEAAKHQMANGQFTKTDTVPEDEAPAQSHCKVCLGHVKTARNWIFIPDFLPDEVSLGREMEKRLGPWA
jgi:hypothetical protein